MSIKCNDFWKKLYSVPKDEVILLNYCLNFFLKHFVNISKKIWDKLSLQSYSLIIFLNINKNVSQYKNLL